MRVLLNGSSLVYPISGVGQYTLQLGKALQHLLGPGNIVWFGKDPFTLAYDLWDDSSAGSVRRLQHGLKEQLRRIPNLNLWVHRWRNFRFASFVRRIKPSLYHETRYALFDFDEGPVVTSIYDLSFVRHPEWHPRDRVTYFENYCVKQLQRVDAIITVSEFSRREIVDLLGIDPARIHVTFPGVDGSFAPQGDRMKELPSSYVLYVGNLEPRKNLPLLLQAHQSLPSFLRKNHPLVVAGAKVWRTREMEALLKPFQRDAHILFTGYIPQGQLPRLYRGACLFAYPSAYEGFGLPVLEAMASGVPAVVANTSSLPEVVADCGILVNPYNVDHLKEAMRELMEDERKREENRPRLLSRL